MDKRREKHEMKRERKTVSFHKDRDADVLAYIKAQSIEFSVLVKQALRDRLK